MSEKTIWVKTGWKRTDKGGENSPLQSWIIDYAPDLVFPNKDLEKISFFIAHTPELSAAQIIQRYADLEAKSAELDRLGKEHEQLGAERDELQKKLDETNARIEGARLGRDTWIENWGPRLKRCKHAPVALTALGALTGMLDAAPEKKDV